VLQKKNNNPNPASDFINVTVLPNSSVELINMTGKQVCLMNNASGLVSIDLRGLPPGPCLIRITTGEKICSKMFVKQ
jgi:hypothetical protein